ncbi:hypothetical protein LTR08_003772 [Meristemomyces frigidus]|nr:hypothetical protein LTR08_003772 [Meristemomyces frigidus]
MPDMTPMRVRGKRGAAKAEKWNAGKKRKIGRDVSPMQPDRNSATVSTVSRTKGAPATRKRKQVQRPLSRLEELPTEILQDIFFYSTNLNLALASPGLQMQLSGQHVYLEHTSRILQPVLGHHGSTVLGPYQLDHLGLCKRSGCEFSTASDVELLAATRLFDCKFMTFSFFQLWLNEKPLSWDQGMLTQRGPEHFYSDLWAGLRPSAGLLPPRKVLTGPWTPDQVCFLRVFVDSLHCKDITVLSPVLGEVATEGLLQAVAEESEGAVPLLLALGQGMRPDTELVRKAVIDHGCNKAIVTELVSCARQRSSPVDLLDPALWSWAEKARASGDEKGEWLVELLRAETGRKSTRFGEGAAQP